MNIGDILDNKKKKDMYIKKSMKQYKSTKELKVFLSKYMPKDKIDAIKDNENIDVVRSRITKEIDDKWGKIAVIRNVVDQYTSLLPTIDELKSYVK